MLIANICGVHIHYQILGERGPTEFFRERIASNPANKSMLVPRVMSG